MTMQFEFVDGAGHCQLHVTVEVDCDRRELFAERVEMPGVLEPAALDRFVGRSSAKMGL